MYFPNICVDNFFNRPTEVVKFANSLQYDKSSIGNWPGKRTRCLSEISPEYFHQFCRKFFSLFFNLRKPDDQYSWKVLTYFHSIDPFEYEEMKTGWIHVDFKTAYAGVIYLSEDISLDCGTSIYKPKKIYDTSIDTNMYLNFDKANMHLYEQQLHENNSKFEETINYKNQFNRLIGYDANQFHGIKNFYDGKSNRLTQVFFITQINSEYFPIPESKKYYL